MMAKRRSKRISYNLKQQVKQIIVVNSKQKATALVVVVRGRAFDLFRMHEKDDYNKILAALQIHFGEQHLQQLL